MGRGRKGWRRGSGQGRKGSFEERKGVIERAFVLQSRYPLLVPPQAPPSLSFYIATTKVSLECPLSLIRKFPQPGPHSNNGVEKLDCVLAS